MSLTQVQPGMLGTPQPYSFKNRIINGAMVISQRGTSGTATSAGSMVLDRFVLYSSNTTPAVTQSSDAPAGFVNSLLWTQSSAATRSAGDYYEIGHKIEGYNIADLNLGTANAKTFTVSFWVKSSVTGTYSFAMRNAGVTYAAYVSTYTISVANTWQQVGVTITGATAGTWNTTNGDGLELWIDLGSGSTYQTSTYNSWIYGNGNALSAASQVGFAQTSGATFYITGVQLEVGVSATTFDYRAYGQELVLCQRYCYRVDASSNANGQFIMGFIYDASNFYGILPIPIQMRVSPSLTTAGSFRVNWAGGGGTVSGSVTINQALPNSVWVNAPISGGTVGSGADLASNASTSTALTLSAEL